MRTRIRCPLCGAMAWESNFKKAPYNLDIFAMACKKSKGKGHGRNTFKFYRIVDKAFEHRVLDFLYRKIKDVERILEIKLGGEEWRKSKSVLIRVVPNTYCLTTTPSSYNRKTNATSSQFLRISKSNFLK